MLHEFDHRSIGQRLELFHFQEEAPGMAFWHPRGFALYRLLEERARALMAEDGYEEVRGPQLLDKSVWERSGHWDLFRENMFCLSDGGKEYGLKPVSCPGHIQIYERRSPSFRDLPLRLSELGLVHRRERSGALQGLFRLAQFVQDDGHIFCAHEDVEAEILKFCRLIKKFYQSLGLDEFKVAFSSRPPGRAGGDENWRRAENILKAAGEAAGFDLVIQEGEGAFYAPKLEFILKDGRQNEWQCGTIQLDMVLPERFDLSYVASGGERRRPAMLHRALFGSLERFMAILLEQWKGQVPVELCPEQVRVLPVNSSAQDYGQEIVVALKARGIRCSQDDGPHSLSNRISEALRLGVPWLVIVGAREKEQRRLSLRGRAGAERPAVPWSEALGLLEASALPSQR